MCINKLQNKAIMKSVERFILRQLDKSTKLAAKKAYDEFGYISSRNITGPWGILEKFMWANAIEGNTILKLISNDNVKQLKNISNAGNHHRS